MVQLLTLFYSIMLLRKSKLFCASVVGCLYNSAAEYFGLYLQKQQNMPRTVQKIAQLYTNVNRAPEIAWKGQASSFLIKFSIPYCCALVEKFFPSFRGK